MYNNNKRLNNEVREDKKLNTIKIYLAESGRIADLKQDFPLYQGQFQNKLLNIYVPTSILAPEFTSSTADGTVTKDYVASTSVQIGMTYVARNGSIKTSKNYYMRFLKTLVYQNVEYALYERKLPQEFTFYAGQGENAPVLIANVVNIEQDTEDGDPTIISIITSQTCSLDVMPSTNLDADEAIEPTELENVNAQISAINAILPTKQDKTDQSLDTTNKTVVGAINELKATSDTHTTQIAQNTEDIATNRNDIDYILNNFASGENYVGQMTGATLPTDEELNTFVEGHTTPSREPRNGDVVIFVLRVAGDTDRNYKYIYSSSGWNGYEIPLLEYASNGTHGIIEGTYAIGSSNTTLVNISGGQILNIYVQDTEGTYRDIREYANTLNTTIQSIIAGNTSVGLAVKALQDGLGNNIVDTYLTQNAGATKQYVRDYALPREFNDIYYLASTGYQPTIPDTPESGVQFSATSSSVGDTVLFNVSKTANAEFELSSKNSTQNAIYVMANVSCDVYFRLTTQAKVGDNDWQDLSVELSNLTSLQANEIYKLSFGSAFTSLGDTVLSLTDTDQVRQIFEVVTQVSTSIVFSVYSNETYPSSFGLNTQATRIVTATGLLGQQPVVYGTGTIEGNTITYALRPDAQLNANTECLFMLTYNGQIPASITVQLSLNDQIIRLATPYNFESGNATIEYLKQINQTYNAINGTTIVFKGFVQTSATGDIYIIVDEDNLSETNGDIAQLQSNVSQNTQNIANIQSDVSQNTQDITQLQSNVSQNTQNITQLQGDVEANATAIETETTNRTTADENLQTQINARATITYVDKQDEAYIGRENQLDFNATLENNTITATLDSSLSDFSFTSNTGYLFHIVLPVVTLTGVLDDNYPIYLQDLAGNLININCIFQEDITQTSTVGNLCQLQEYNESAGYSWSFYGHYKEINDNGTIRRVVYTDTVIHERNTSMTGNAFANAIGNASLKPNTTVLITETYSANGMNFVQGHSYLVIGQMLDGEVVLDYQDISTFIDYVNDQTLTPEQQQRVRTAIGAGSSAFDGNYNSLQNIPTLNTDNTAEQTPSANEQISETINLHRIAKTGNFEDLNNVPQASNAQAGIIQIATDTETQAGTIETKAVNPKQLKTAIDGLGNVFDLKGSVQSVSNLPSTGNTIGDVWYVTDESVGYVWLNDGTADRWEQLGLPIDLSGYVQIVDIVNNLTSTSIDAPLSAYQGNVLKGLIDTINSTLSTLQTTVSGQGTRLSTAEGDITNLETDVGILQVDNQTNQQNISTLQSGLSTETQNRKTADSNLQTQINQKANQSDLTAEINNRTSADSNLQSQINNKANSNNVVDLSSIQTITPIKHFKNASFDDINISSGAGTIGVRIITNNDKNTVSFLSSSNKTIFKVGESFDNPYMQAYGYNAKITYEKKDLSNGYYIKYTDGTMEQHFTVTGSRGKVTSHNFLASFKTGTTPIVHRTIAINGSGNANQLRGWNVSNLTNTGFQIYTTDITGAEASMISAYGKWK